MSTPRAKSQKKITSTSATKRTFKRLVNITDDQKTVCNEATNCIYQLDIILKNMIPIVQGENSGNVSAVLELKAKLDEINKLVANLL